MERNASDNAEGAESDADGHTNRHCDAQAPGINGAAGNRARFISDRDQSRLGNGGAEANGDRENINPEIILPGSGHAFDKTKKFGIGELARHSLAERK